MSKGIEALVEPQLLSWARRTSGLDIGTSAKKAQVQPEELNRWEKGEGRPSIPQLRRLARVYKRPIAVFYLPEPPADFQPLRDFRRLAGLLASTESAELRFEVRQAQNRREFAIELYELMEGPPLRFDLTATLSDNPEEVALRLRQFLDVSYGNQLQWKPGYDAFNHWRAALGRVGVLVFQAADTEVAEARGFSIYAEQFPAVVVNIKDSVSGRIFTMLHELSHLALHEGGLCDLSEEGRLFANESQIEVFCNRVAGATIVPRRQLLEESVVVSKSHDAQWEDDEIRFLADRYSCSREVILRRLLICGRLTEEFYRAKRSQLLKEFETEKAERKEGYAPPHRVAVSTAGPFFVSLVLNNYYQGNINVSDVSEFLGARLKHLGKIESAVLASSA